jgi:hypothetical protein
VYTSLHLAAHPIGDGLQPPEQGLHEVHQLPHPLKSCLNRNFTEKFVIYLFQGLVIFHLFFIRFDQNCFSDYCLNFPKNCQESTFLQKGLRKSFSLRAVKIH